MKSHFIYFFLSKGIIPINFNWGRFVVVLAIISISNNKTALTKLIAGISKAASVETDGEEKQDYR